LQAFVVVPVAFAGGDCGEAGLVEAAGVEKDLEDGVVVGFGDVVRSFLVVGIGAVVEQELGEAGILSEAGGS
jgi:hypothetical protein